MRRTPFRSKVGVSAGARHVRLPAKRETERRSSRVRDEDALNTSRNAFSPDVTCAIKRHFGAAIDECSGAVEPDHQRDMTGMGMKASDAETYPACRHHHEQQETYQLPGAETCEGRKALRARLIADHRPRAASRASMPF